MTDAPSPDPKTRVGFIAEFTDAEDHRKTGLKNGIRQLTNDQILRTINYEGCLAVDDGNFVNGCYCPLAVGAGIDQLHWAKPPTDAAVAAMLHLMGFRVNNTRGIKGTFFRENRVEDYRTACYEVLSERGWTDWPEDIRPIRFSHVDALGRQVPDEVKIVIVQGFRPGGEPFTSRSEMEWWVVCELVRAGLDQYTVCSVLVNRDWKISEGILAQNQPVRHCVRLFTRAKAEAALVQA